MEILNENNSESGGEEGSLREWLATSPFEGSPSLLANYLQVPVKTVEGWLYEQKMPKPPARWRLYLLSGLDRLAPENHRQEEALLAVKQEEKKRAEDLADELEETVEKVWEHLEFFVLSPPERREVLREHVGEKELEAIGQMFRRFADPAKFSAWQSLRLLRRQLGGS